jgi:hypothetical protein
LTVNQSLTAASVPKRKTQSIRRVAAQQPAPAPQPESPAAQPASAPDEAKP